ncbi:MAG: phosphohistidine phosphatase SixA [Deltaproteobacteria bacterium]|nr:phosphohistidine phosphatase SixA [Deltaproteobacteria bacterium]
MKDARVLLVRHGDAVDGYGMADELRWLTDKGRSRTRAVAQKLEHEGIRFDRVLTSALVRAVQTAEILATCGAFEGPLEVYEPLGHMGRLTGLGALDGHHSGVWALVGHEPSMGLYASKLLGKRFPAFKKSAALLLHRRDGEHRFEWYLKPGKLELIRSLADVGDD